MSLLDSRKEFGRELKNDLINRRFGRLLVLYRTDYDNRNVMWMCLCDCGSLASVAGSGMLSGSVNSCGCFRKEFTSKNKKTHGHASDGKITGTYTAWTGMKGRCNNKNSTFYHRYGGRGITVCERWAKFENFYYDMGDVPDKMTIERKDNNKGYSPENCKWATMEEQANNTSRNKYYDYGGKSMTMSQISRLVGMERKTITKRMERGMSLEESVAKDTVRLFTHDGMTMSIKDWAKYTGVKRRNLDLRLERGWSIERTLTEPARGFKKK